MALDTLLEVTYVCPIYSVGSNLTVMTVSQREHTDLLDPKHDCMTVSAVHDRIDKEPAELEKGQGKSEGYTLFSLPRKPSRGIKRASLLV